MLNFRITKYLKLFGLVIVFVFPFFLGSLLYIFREECSFHSTAKGELLTPDLAHKRLGVPPDVFLGKWNLVYFPPAICDQACLKKKKLLDNIIIALGKDSARVRMQMLSTQTLEKNLLNNISLDGFEDKQSVFDNNNPMEDSVLIIDPQGWLVLHYPSSKFYGKGVLEDLRRLLRFSHVG